MVIFAIYSPFPILKQFIAMFEGPHSYKKYFSLLG